MNYYQARQRKDGIWHWTCMNDGEIRAAPPCTQECQHKTAEEAERHFYEHEITDLRICQSDAWYKCEVDGCEVLSNKALVPRHGGGAYLCDVHRTAEEYRTLRPFAAGTQIASSW